MLTSKNMTNRQIAELLIDVAAAHQLVDPKTYKFQIIAYNRAASSVEHATSELKDLWDDGKLDSVPGIGKSIAGHLSEIFSTGKSRHFEQISKGIPVEVFKLMELPGIGIKTAIKMVKEESKTEIKKKLDEVNKIRNKNKRHLLPYAQKIASELTKWLLDDLNCKNVQVLGSLRRKVATIGDIDIAVATNNPVKTIEHFVNFPKLQKIIEKGDKTASILVPGGVSVDLLVSSVDSFGSALQHFTGSKFHNIALREYANKLGYSLSEYGIKKKKSKKETSASTVNKFRDEKSFYNFLKLDYIEPEIREGTDEIKASMNHTLPKLVEVGDLKGDLHIHSNYDIETSHDLGLSSMKDLVKKANELKYEYLAMSEHNPSKSKHTEAQIVDILKRKREKVEQLNYSLSKTKNNSVKKVFNSLEIDIMPDGLLPVSGVGLQTLDFAIVSVHSSFRLKRNEMTKRVLSALAHPKVLIFAHPVARKINQREGIDLNWEQIFEFCVKNNKILEINSSPARLDLPDLLVRDAVNAGVKMSINTDSHHLDHMDGIGNGVSVARRGWCEKKDIINTMSLEKFKEVIQ
ncbi:hypothetical protein ISR94_01690 [Candidatus Microgenomates bacterium]|nr:hypothetical protein [Candidatus Microgenomates bacterium]